MPKPSTVMYCKSPLTLAISSVLLQAWQASPAHAQEQLATTIAEIVVTATRRAESVQDVPLNITAFSGGALEEQGISSLAEIGRTVPGLYVRDQGPSTPNRMIVRGLSADGVGEGNLSNSGGSTVATYVGEIPLYIDMRLDDIERVEVLLGPQGTLYGSGTMGGAIRFIPRRPQFNQTTVSVRGEAFGLAESDDLGGKAGATLNLPFGDTFALRASVDYLDDPGFIDSPFLVRQPGVSDPQPDFSDPDAVAANLRREKDTNFEETLSGRVGLRWRPTERIDANLTYYYQDQQVGDSRGTHKQAFGTGDYESASRFVGPVERENQLTALEITADLGFAELTSATGVSRFDEKGQDDQTDILLTLDYGYELFPTFSDFVNESIEEETFSQELRLVSKSEGPLNWIVGAFYKEFEGHELQREFAPGYSEFFVNVLNDGEGNIRPDAMDFIQERFQDVRESAVYGEIGYRFTDNWQVTIGGRFYDYEIKSRSGSDIPIINSAFGAPPDEINLVLTSSGQSDSGSLFKFNTSYDFSDDVMGYLTVSEGYRFGDANSLPPCGEVPPGVPCVAPEQEQYFPDTTTNHEIGLRTQWFARRLTLNASVFYVDWQDPQLLSTSQGGFNITVNGDGAESRGVELSFDARLTDRFALRGSYAYTQAELTADAPDLIETIVPPGFVFIRLDGRAGDRLPGTPEHQGALYASYEMPLASNLDLDLNYGVTAMGDVLTRAGGRGDGETLGGFALHSASAVLRADRWSIALYGENLLNKYAVTNVSNTALFVQDLQDINGDPVAVRLYTKSGLRPRQIGLRFTYDFEL